jgi:hypothetical protein
VTRLLSLSGACLLGLVACAPAPTPATTAPAPSASASGAPAGEARTGWDEQPWGRFRSRRFSLWLALPDGKAWRIDDHRTSWLVATHAPSSSSLGLRVFFEDEATNPARCEARARQHDGKLPAEADGRVLERSSAEVLPGWDTRSFVLSTLRSAPGAPLDLEGHRVVFAASIRKCMVIHYATRAVGPGAEAVLGRGWRRRRSLRGRSSPGTGSRGPGKSRPFERPEAAKGSLLTPFLTPAGYRRQAGPGLRGLLPAGHPDCTPSASRGTHPGDAGAVRPELHAEREPGAP